MEEAVKGGFEFIGGEGGQFLVEAGLAIDFEGVADADAAALVGSILLPEIASVLRVLGLALLHVKFLSLARGYSRYQ